MRCPSRSSGPAPWPHPAMVRSSWPLFRNWKEQANQETKTRSVLKSEQFFAKK
uniref:Uncharacterized protein n=1 Tax=Arundo donax TaxID=35708 RepID=A0A0A9G3L3_ARUDO